VKIPIQLARVKLIGLTLEKNYNLVSDYFPVFRLIALDEDLENDDRDVGGQGEPNQSQTLFFFLFFFLSSSPY
jgi:hypothetical protein